MTSSITLAQITDTHLLADCTIRLRGWDVWQCLQRVLRQVRQHHPDGLLLTGDLADQGCAAAYSHLRRAIAPLNLPTYWLPGNHDHLATMQAVLPAAPLSANRSINLGTWRLLLLNSVLPDAKFGEGQLPAAELQWLKSELITHNHQPTAIALHHHPIPTGIDWLDQMQVQNAPQLLTLLEEFPQVRLVVFGHIHHEFAQEKFIHRQDDGRGKTPLTFYGCPATGPQVLPPQATDEAQLPGFRLLTLRADGRHQTRVVRVAYPG
jgi:Icc protein